MRPQLRFRGLSAGAPTQRGGDQTIAKNIRRAEGAARRIDATQYRQRLLLAAQLEVGVLAGGLMWPLRHVRRIRGEETVPGIWGRVSVGVGRHGGPRKLV